MDDFIMAVKTHNVTDKELAAILCSIEGLDVRTTWMTMIKDDKTVEDRKIGQPFSCTIQSTLSWYNNTKPKTIIFGAYDPPISYTVKETEPNYLLQIQDKTIVAFSPIKSWDSETFLKDMTGTPVNSLIAHWVEDNVTKAIPGKNEELYLNIIQHEPQEGQTKFITMVSNSNYFAYKTANILNVMLDGGEYKVVFEDKMEEEDTNYIIEDYV